MAQVFVVIFPRCSVRIIDIGKPAQDFITVSPGAPGLISNGRESVTAIIGEVQASSHVAHDPDQLIAGVESSGLGSARYVGDIHQETIGIEIFNCQVFIGIAPAIGGLFQCGAYAGVRLVAAAIPCEVDFLPVGPGDFDRIGPGINRDFDITIISMCPVVDERV